MATKTCTKCGGNWPLSFFHTHWRGNRKRADCIGCRPERRNSLYFKAKNSRARHAKNRDLAAASFAEQFGWALERMVDDLKATTACPYCLMPISDPARLTFDVIDPAKMPHYSNNVRVCCLDCNSAKSNLDPDAWAERLETWIKYRKWMANLKTNPLFQLPLFSE